MNDKQYSEQQGRQFWFKSILVGIALVILGVIYAVDSAPNDMNIGFWLYSFLGVFALWPYQIVLTLKLRRCRGDASKYLGVALSVASLAMSYRLWL